MAIITNKNQTNDRDNQPVYGKNFMGGFSFNSPTSVEKENDTDDVDEVIEETTTVTTVKKDKSNVSDINFQSHINSMARKIESSKNIQIKNKIEAIVLEAVNSVQVRFEQDDNNKTVQIRYFKDKDNSVLLSNVLDEVVENINELSINNMEKSTYFTNVIDGFICDRLTFMTNIALSEQLSPFEIDNAMRTFVSSGDKYINEEVLNDYYEKYKDFCFKMIYNRIDKSTFYISELLSETISIAKKETGTDISVLVNELLLEHIDSRYVDMAKENLYKKKPKNTQYTKANKALLKALDNNK